MFCASFRRPAIIRRKRDIGTRSSRASLARGPVLAGAGADEAVVIFAEPLAIAFCTSALVRRPSLPVPEIAFGFILFSSTNLRTAGDNIPAAPEGAEAAATGADFVAGVGVGAAASGAIAAGFGAGVVVAAAPSLTMPSRASTSTVAPSLATMSDKTPFTGDGTSRVTLSVSNSTIGSSAAIAADEPIVELETDKVTLEVPSPVNGVLSDIVASEGATVEVDALLGMVKEGAAATTTPAPKPAAIAPEAAAPTPTPATKSAPVAAASAPSGAAGMLSPAVRKLVEENNINPNAISGTGKDGRLTKADVQKAIASGSAKMTTASSAPAPAKTGPRASDAREERVPMSRLRRMIAGRLKEAQNTAAMLTTFNEVDMSAVMALRSEYKDDFEKQHGARLGQDGRHVAFQNHLYIPSVVPSLRSYPPH